MSYRLLRPLLFGLDAETSHGLATAALEAAQLNPLLLRRLRRRNHAHDGPLRKTVAGIEFPNPIGLAAGFDKNAKLVEAMAALGFGFVEVGTVTPRPQAGNPKPRLFRLPEEQSLQNAMGFNNDGMEIIYQRLKRGWPYSVPVGVNLGRNKDTPNEKTLDDYLMLLNTFADVGDYYVINVSSPNTPGLRDF
ncbi:MAG: dihydroorotate dehydrogenase (quinone), partial [Candidatus Hydrogenedentota bacterium]